ncbi:hypothetical protein OAU50_04440 [Planctomycetota bacterium]|nr:hypothetical protein [Planctomycetota bacterium]
MPFVLLLLMTSGVAVWFVFQDEATSNLPNYRDQLQACREYEEPSVVAKDIEDPPNSHRETEPDKPTAKDLLDRFNRANKGIEEKTKKLEGTNGKLPEVADETLSEDEIRRRIEEIIKNSHARLSDPEHKKDKNNQRHLRLLKELVNESKEVWEQFKMPEGEVSFISPDSGRKKFTDEYLSPFDLYFDTKVEPGTDAEVLYELLSSVSSYSGCRIGQATHFTEKVDYSLKWGNDTFPLNAFELWDGEVRVRYPLDPTREIALWSNPEEINQKIAKWASNVNLTPIQTRVLINFVVTASTEFGCDLVHLGALAVVSAIPNHVLNWSAGEHIADIEPVIYAMDELATVVFVGSDESCRHELEAIQKMIVSLVLALQDNGMIEKHAYSADLLESIRLVRTHALKIVNRVMRSSPPFPGPLNLGVSGIEREVDAPTITQEAFSKLHDGNEDWYSAAILYPAIRHYDGEKSDSTSTIEEIVSALKEKQLGQDLKKELVTWGGTIVPHLAKELETAKSQEAATRLLRAYSFLCEERSKVRRCAIVLAKDHRAFRKAAASLLSASLSLSFADRTERTPSATELSQAFSEDMNHGYRFTATPNYDVDLELAHARVATAMIDGVHPNVLLGDMSGRLGWQENEISPKSFGCIKEIELARLFLKASISVRGKAWQDAGAYLGILMERLSGFRIETSEHRNNPKVWSQLLDVTPDFSLVD